MTCPWGIPGPGAARAPRPRRRRLRVTTLLPWRHVPAPVWAHSVHARCQEEDGPGQGDVAYCQEERVRWEGVCGGWHSQEVPARRAARKNRRGNPGTPLQRHGGGAPPAADCLSRSGPGPGRFSHLPAAERASRSRRLQPAGQPAATNRRGPRRGRQASRFKLGGATDSEPPSETLLAAAPAGGLRVTVRTLQNPTRMPHRRAENLGRRSRFRVRVGGAGSRQPPPGSDSDFSGRCRPQAFHRRRAP